VTGTGLNQFASTTSSQLAGVISDETGSGLLTFATTPTFTTNITTPLVIGGTATGSTLILKGTTANGTTSTAAVQLNVGNNGATTGISIINNGNVGIGTSSTPTASLFIRGGTTSASTAAIKFATGSLMTAAEAGAMEYNGTDLYFTGNARDIVMTGRKGSFSQVGTATTVFTVTIGATQSNATYNVQVTPTAALSAALFYVTNKTTTTFDVTFLAGLTGSVTFDWQIIQ
jgi:hypothetical protein